MPAAEAAASPSVELEDLAVRRGRRLVLERCTAQIGQGITAVVGRNGSGKTSLVRTLATVAPPAGGRLELAGHPVDRHRDRLLARRSLGYVPQEWALPGSATVEDALRHAAWLHRVADPDRAVDDALERLDLGVHRRQRLGRLSVGTRRRVAIGQAVVHHPAVLILDEPSAGLDAEQRDLLWTLLEERAERAAVLVVTHDLAEAEQRSRAILVVAGGTLRTSAPGERPILGPVAAADDR